MYFNLAELTQEVKELIQNLKINKLLIKKELESTKFTCITDKISVKNVAFYHKLADLFKVSNLSQIAFSYIERCFTMVAETKNFLETDLAIVKKTLYSSELYLTSELEIFDAANNWISYNTEERSKFAVDLLLSVRLPLLSDHALNYLLCNKISTICKVDECRSIIESVLLKNEKFTNNQVSDGFMSRYCNQSLFDILLCKKQFFGSSIIKQTSYHNFNSTKTLASFENGRENIGNAVWLKGDLYLFVQDKLRIRKYSRAVRIKKYSNASELWESGVVLDYRDEFCACALMDDIYVVGGRKKETDTDFHDSCVRYNTKGDGKKEVAGLNRARYSAACAVFQGKLVVSGGMSPDDRLYGYMAGMPTSPVSSTNTVEAYDHVADAWSCMPSTVLHRVDHSLVPIKTKLFVIGRSDLACEVFDGTAGKFAVIKSSPVFHGEKEVWFHGEEEVWVHGEEGDTLDKVRAVSMGSKIAVFGREHSTVQIYDTETDEWTDEPGEFSDEVILDCLVACCIKVPQV